MRNKSSTRRENAIKTVRRALIYTVVFVPQTVCPTWKKVSHARREIEISADQIEKQIYS